MNLNHIKSFIAVSKLLSFTKAAKLNNVPQSTISRHINDLENQLGAKLFFRTKRDVRLTEEGKVFMPYAQEMLDAARKGTQAVQQLKNGSKGYLSIASVMTSDYFLYKCLRSFNEKYPGITVDITHISSGNMMTVSADESFDFQFLFEEMAPSSDEINVLKTYKDKLAVTMPKGYIESSGIKSPFDINGENFILLSAEESPILNSKVMRFVNDHKIIPKSIITSNDIKSVALYVSAGMGISLVPSTLPNKLLSSTLDTMTIDDSRYSISCAVAWNKSLLNPAASLFLEVIKEQLETFSCPD